MVDVNSSEGIGLLSESVLQHQKDFDRGLLDDTHSGLSQTMSTRNEGELSTLLSLKTSNFLKVTVCLVERV